MKRILAIILTLISIALYALEPHFMFDPAISADGEVVCFVYHDRLWTVNWEGGEARSLTSVDVNTSSPQFSPDNKSIAYMTSRDGYQCIYVIPAAGGEAAAVTYDDFTLCDWFPNGKSLLVTRRLDRYKTEYFQLFLDGRLKKITSYSGSFSSLNNKGDKIIFCNRGYPYREKYSGSANGDLWIYDITKDEYIRLTETSYTERYPQFSWNHDRIYFGASDGEIFQLFQVDGLDFDSKKALTDFDTWSLRDLDVAHDNDRIVFEHFDQIYKYDPDVSNGKAIPLHIEIKEDIIASPLQKEKYHNSVKKYDVSSDGKLAVFNFKYDLFAMPVAGGEVKQITFDQKGIEDIVIMPDNKTVIFSKIIEGCPQLFRFNIMNIDDVQKLDWSSDRYIEYLENQNGHLVIGFSTPTTRFQRTAVGDSLGNNIQVLPLEERTDYGVLDKEGRYFLYRVTDFKVWSREMKIYDRKTDEIYSLGKTSSWYSSPSWGKDNKSAFYTKNGDIFRLDLQPKSDFYYQDEDPWNDILNENNTENNIEKEPQKDTIKSKVDDGMQIDFKGLDKRYTSIVDKEGYSYILYLTDELIYYVNKNDDNDLSLWQIEYSGENDKEIKKLPSDAEDIICRNDKWFYVSHASLYEMPLSGGSPEQVKNEFKYEFDRHQLNKDIFDQVWLRFGRGFYDPKMHDLNWQKIHKKYARYLEYANSPAILANIVDEMIGELNASHTGFYPRSENSHSTIRRAYIGAVMNLAEFPENGITFQKIYRHSSLALDHQINAGDVLLSVDGIQVGKEKPFDQLFRDKIGVKIELVIDVGDSSRTVELKGISYGDQYKLWYDDWVETRREKVDELSNGRIAYSHISGMDNRSYEKFEDELFSLNFDKQALIIDVRFNGGGYTHDKILETLTKRQYGWSSSRYADAVPYPTPNNIWDKPVVLLIDEDSFSDAEIFPILFKHLKLGKVIGMPTSGSVIGTGHINFMDGSSMRMPSSGWFEMNLSNMEGVGAHPDILVPMNPKDYINDNDLQLQRAVLELQKELH